MYQWSLHANLFMGGQCIFVIDLCNTVNQLRRCTGPTNKFACYVSLNTVYFILNNTPISWSTETKNNKKIEKINKLRQN